VFPWAASGRSLSLGRDEGLTKVLFDEANDRVIGAGIVGPNAGDLIAEAALAIEIGAVRKPRSTGRDDGFTGGRGSPRRRICSVRC
jgi:pyruvate/2-oxoglutarate dehydrogenase complex dihydrolipoamide dehydrogenase (E3) component